MKFVGSYRELKGFTGYKTFYSSDEDGTKVLIFKYYRHISIQSMKENEEVLAYHIVKNNFTKEMMNDFCFMKKDGSDIVLLKFPVYDSGKLDYYRNNEEYFEVPSMSNNVIDIILNMYNSNQIEFEKFKI